MRCFKHIEELKSKAASLKRTRAEPSGNEKREGLLCARHQSHGMILSDAVQKGKRQKAQGRMEIAKLASQITAFSPFIAASLIVGWFIPRFYIWTDSDQSRPSPLLWLVPLGSAIVSMAFCAVLPWLPIANQTFNKTSPPRLLFSIRTLLLITAVVAVAIVLLAKFPLLVSGTVSAGTFMYLIAFGVYNPQHRMAVCALVASMNFPYIWIVGYNELGRILQDLLVIFAGLPAFIPAVLLGRLVNQNMHDGLWLALLLTALEIVIGIWMIRLGPKRTIAYLLLVLHLSALGSLGFHMAVLA